MSDEQEFNSIQSSEHEIGEWYTKVVHLNLMGANHASGNRHTR